MSEVMYSIPENLMKSIYLALFNRQKICRGGMFVQTATDYEITNCIAQLDKLSPTSDFKKDLIFGEHKYIDIRTMADSGPVLIDK